MVLVSIQFVNVAYYAVQRWVLNASYPMSDYFFSPSARFSDFKRDFRMWTDNSTSEALFYRRAATTLDPFPIWNLAHFPFSRLHNELVSLWVYEIIAILLIACGTYIALNKQSRSIRIVLAVVITSFSYASQFTLERGNIEFLSFFFVAIAVSHFNEDRISTPIFLAIAVGVKPWAGILLLLWIIRRQFRDIIIFTFVYLGLVVTCPLIIRVWARLPLTEFFNPKYQFSHFSDYAQNYVASSSSGSGIAYGNSLYGLLRIIAASLGATNPNELLRNWYVIWVLFSLCGLLWIIGRHRTETMLEVAALLAFVTVTPFVSGDYKLLYMIIVTSCFLQLPRTEVSERTRRGILTICAVVLGGKSFLRIDTPMGLSLSEPILSSVLLSPILIVAILVTIVLIYRDKPLASDLLRDKI